MGTWNRFSWRVSLELVTSGVLMVAAAVVLWNGLMTSSPPPPTEIPLPTELQRLDRMHVKGSLRAEVAIIVYSDFQCPFCGQFARETLPVIEDRYISSGRVVLAFRHSPIERIHPGALKAAEAAECAARQNRFWVMHDALFRAGARFDTPGLLEAATTAGLKVDEAVACLNQDGSAKVRADRLSAVALGLTGTPAFLFGTVEDGGVRVQQVLKGAQPSGKFAAVLDDLLRQADRQANRQALRR